MVIISGVGLDYFLHESPALDIYGFQRLDLCVEINVSKNDKGQEHPGGQGGGRKDYGVGKVYHGFGQKDGRRIIPGVKEMMITKVIREE
ncbi:hypothetical protein NPIL_621441 [Nephila pilipes]|uniref:Uncharacterized protein n=1 Tax=Nephila pilipes TaxID=299642 RepID=A0A8X6TUG9_NEPPI|nr:hypothetical protein NPIL_621441 [Nephila pilipes]